jgi:putative flippase GtrA
MVFFILDTFFEDIFTKRYFAYMSAMILGQIVATINAFVLHKYVTFKSEVKGKGIIPEFFRFCMTYVFTFSLGLVLLPFFVEIVHLHPRIAAAIVILICTLISYVGHSRFSFSPTNKK